MLCKSLVWNDIRSVCVKTSDSVDKGVDLLAVAGMMCELMRQMYVCMMTSRLLYFQ